VTGTHTDDSQQVALHADDSDLQKGATEGTGEDCGNRNAEGALDDSGLPRDEVKIAEDVLGANEDQTQG
jgi:hypothetical protein